MNRGTLWLLILALAGASGVAWHRQRSIGQQLREEIEVARTEAGIRAQLIADNQHLAARQPTVADIEGLRADRQALLRLKSEVERAKSETERMEQAAKSLEPPGPVMIRVADLKNAGRAAPAVAMQTMVWAAANGDLELLAQCFMWDPSVRATAERMWTELPEKIRAEHGSLERLMATFLAQHEWAGLTQVGVAEVREEGKDTAFVHNRIDKGGKQGGLSAAQFQRTDDGWRFVFGRPALGLLRRLRDQK